MINKIDGSRNYVYTKQKKIERSDSGEKFSLDYKNGESLSEAKDKKELSRQKKEQSVERDGVRLELSGNMQTAGADRQEQTKKENVQSEPARISLFETIRAYVMTAVATVREFFHKIWTDQPAEEVLSETSEVDEITDTDEIADTSDGETVLVAETASEHLDREILQFLRDGDVDQAINLLTDNGRRTVAKNSTLLTSYNKDGRVVEPSASVRERALYGDRNTWKL